jgi:hypothetical protein
MDSSMVDGCGARWIGGPWIRQLEGQRQMKNEDPDVWTLTFRREAGHGIAPTSVRVRRLLKACLRSFGLRCTHVSSPSVEDTTKQLGAAANGPPTSAEGT